MECPGCKGNRWRFVTYIGISPFDEEALYQCKDCKTVITSSERLEEE